MPFPRAVRAAEVEVMRARWSTSRRHCLVIDGASAPSEDFPPPSRCFSAIEGWTPTASFPRPHEPPHDAARQGRGYRYPHLGGSCGSGTIACAVAESAGLADGLWAQVYFSRAGVVARASESAAAREIVSAAIIGGRSPSTSPVHRCKAPLTEWLKFLTDTEKSGS